MPIPGNCLTTAMGILPHTDVDRALEVALSLDIPFWPQLPRLSYYEDMYVQVSENFPGVRIDVENRRIDFSTERFYEELPAFLERMDDPDLYRLSERYSVVYRRFLELDLADRPAIRGQMEGPISFGFSVKDESDRPLIYDDEVRGLLIEFLARKVNVMGQELRAKNPNAFMFVDEPGLEFLFSALAGYTDTQARQDLDTFFSLIEGRRGVHLCGNPDWDFLLNTPMDVLSFNAFGSGERFVNYAPSLRRFLESGGVIGWGIVPANYDEYRATDLTALLDHLERLWDALEPAGLTREVLLPRSLLLPATCALVNPDKEATVEACYELLRELSFRVRERYGLREETE
ncbi:uroporphyrinogen decarboxylase/cobalamine-independent methonine synthase family protein [Deferrisoma sp.]